MMSPISTTAGTHSFVVGGLSLADTNASTLVVWLVGLAIICSRDVWIESIRNRNRPDPEDPDSGDR